MVKIYGIKNCDTMKKAFQWLDKQKIEYSFHDYKKSGIDSETIHRWMKKIPLDKLVNSKGTTWKKQSDQDKVALSDPKRATTLIIQNTSLLKRPLLEIGKEDYLVGFDEVVWGSKMVK
ncbi:MAG TPA: Spx/MgsR family RNA polymerase-binding regulatory protein [Cytophagaceae bacterium]|jgi:arsenate reductase|nr:Spx/MgsR family RNA polymerase-binding regulatory protein [Cytophagaceae bacterium]